MKIHRPPRPPRVAFLFEPERAVHVPSRCDWCDARRVEVPRGGWAAACRELASDAPDLVVAFDPGDGALALADAPGLRVAIVLDARRGAAVASAQRAGAVDAFTWPERWPGADDAPFQLLPPPLDDALLGTGPRLEASGVLVAGWAPPPADVLRRLRGAATTLPADSGVEQVLAAAGSAAVLLWSCGEPTLPADARLVAALSRGLLVVADAPPPREWALDVGDDLVACVPAEMPSVVERAATEPALVAPIRVRAWQRTRESFSSAAIERLVHDARLLLPRRDGAAREGQA